jgi:arabinofuranosyltransferase
MKNVLPLAVLLVICSIFVAHAVYLNCVAEDAFISFRFARNLADGFGLRWNTDENPVEGYTNFLWVILAALAVKLGLFLPRFSQVLGMAAGVATILGVYIFSRKTLGLTSMGSALPCLFLALSGPFATWSSSGMETSLFGLFLLVGVLGFISYLRSQSLRLLYLGYFSLLAASLTRPEGFGVFLIVSGLHFLAVCRRKMPSRPFAFSVLLYGLPFLMYFAWRLQYFGFLLPNTFYAKTGGSLYQYLRGLKYSGLFCAFYILPFIPLAVFLIWERWKASPGSGTIRDRIPGTGPGLGVIFLVCTLFTLYIVYVGGDYMAMFRFYAPLLPLIYFLMAAAVHSLFARLKANRGKRVFAAVGLVLFLASTLFHSTPLEMTVFPEPSFMHGTYRGVQTERWHVARLSLIGKFFDRYKKSEQESLTIRAIGAISFYARLKIYDQDGLVDPEIAHQKTEDLGRGFPGHEKTNVLHALLKKPNYFVFDRRIYKKPIRPPSYGAEANALIRENYRLSQIWLEDRVNDEKGYLTFLELKKNKRK